jgi:hypothetical protein
MDYKNSPIVAKVIFILIIAALGGISIARLVGDAAESFVAPIIRALAPSSGNSISQSAILDQAAATGSGKTEACKSAIARSVLPLQST